MESIDFKEHDLKEVPHHKQEEFCTTRPAYRQGRKLTAVKVFTVTSESQHLFVYGVPKINLRTELKSLFNKYGQVLNIHVVPDHLVEIFTECYHVHYQRIQSARIAKRFNDNKSFYGGVLHVCYAPEYETLEETMIKLQQREKDVHTRLAEQHSRGSVNELTMPKTIENSVERRNCLVSISKSESDVGIETIPHIYSKQDPILALDRDMKKHNDPVSSKYISQSSDVYGGLKERKRKYQKANISNDLIPFPLRHKQICSDVEVCGPQFQCPNQGSKKKMNQSVMSFLIQ